MGWAFVYLFVVLKIPVVAAIWIVWWASRDANAGDQPGDGGIRRDHPPVPPRLPRRGPHGGDPPPAPPRVRMRPAELARR
jgi:hypothetical protein